MSNEQKNPEQVEAQAVEQIADLPEQPLTAEDAEAVKGGDGQYFVVNLKQITVTHLQSSTPPRRERRPSEKKWSTTPAICRPGLCILWPPDALPARAVGACRIGRRARLQRHGRHLPWRGA
jgi:hypothetical protein